MTRRERAQVKRRTAIEEQAIDYLKAALTSFPGRRMGTAVQQVRRSPRPMTTAKAIVKGWRQVSGNGGTTVEDGSSLPDLSAATEARASLLRRQPPSLRRWPAYDDEIGELERALLKGHVSQGAFDRRCERIGQRALPPWMIRHSSGQMKGVFQ